MPETRSQPQAKSVRITLSSNSDVPGSKLENGVAGALEVHGHVSNLPAVHQEQG
jgi:hypothetical protein